MRCRWPDGRTVAISGTGKIAGTPSVVASADRWLIAQDIRSGFVAVTPTGPFVAPGDPLAAFTAVNAVAPGGQWDAEPDLTFGTPDGAIN